MSRLSPASTSCPAGGRDTPREDPARAPRVAVTSGVLVPPDDPPGGSPGVVVRALAIVMGGLSPAALALETAAALPRLGQYGPPAVALAVLRALVAGMGMAVAPALWSGRPGAPHAARGWLLLDAAAGTIALLTPYFPSNRTPGGKALALAAAVAFNGAWYVYLRRARRVRVTWPDAGDGLL